MEDLKDIIEIISTLAKRELANCKGCEGNMLIRKCKGCEYSEVSTLGIHCIKKGNCPTDVRITCPTCAPLRTVAEMHIHRWGYLREDGTLWRCSICDEQRKTYGNEPRPVTPSIPELRSYMEIVGVWERFIRQVYDSCWRTTTDTGMKVGFLYSKFADILISEKFYGAVEEFLKGEVENEY